MERGSLIFGVIIRAAVRYILYNSSPSKFAKLEEGFGGFKDLRKKIKRVLITIVYGSTGSGKTYSV